jgi:cbb3-type cytochrome oxidase subunit 3
MGCLLWHHCLIAIHRLIVVVYPNLLRRMSVKTYVIVSLVITRILPILCCIPSFITYSIGYSIQALRCSIRDKLQIYINLTILIALPNVIIIFCFVGIFFHVYRASYKNRLTTTISTSLSHSLRREIRITKMFAVLFTLFFLGYHPYGFVRAYDKRRQLHPDIFVLLTLLYCISICASPFVYGIMNDQLRRECMRVIFNCWHCQPIDDYKNYSHHRLNSAVTKPLTGVNGNNGGAAGGGYDSRASPSTASMRDLTFKSTRIKTSSVTMLDSAHV